MGSFRGVSVDGADGANNGGVEHSGVNDVGAGVGAGVGGDCSGSRRGAPREQLHREKVSSLKKLVVSELYRDPTIK